MDQLAARISNLIQSNPKCQTKNPATPHERLPPTSSTDEQEQDILPTSKNQVDMTVNINNVSLPTRNNGGHPRNNDAATPADIFLKNSSILATDHHPRFRYDDDADEAVDYTSLRRAEEKSMHHPNHDNVVIARNEKKSSLKKVQRSTRWHSNYSEGSRNLESVGDAEGEENDNDVAQVQYESNVDDDDHDVSVGEVSEEIEDIVGDEIGGEQESKMDSTTVLEDSAEQKELENEEGEPYQQQEAEAEAEAEEEEEEEDEMSEQEQKQQNEEAHAESDGDYHTQEGEGQENMPSMDELVPEEQESQNQNGNTYDNQPVTNIDWDPYHLLHPKNKVVDQTNPSLGSSSTSHTIGTVVSLSFFAATSFFVCICCLRYYSRRRKPHFHGSHNRYSSNANNNKYYSALHGSDDFFDGTFSDDVSYFEKDSDDDEEDCDDDDYDTLPMNYSHDSDDDFHNVSSQNGSGGGGVRLEMRGRNVSNGVMHESLTLDECNG